MQPNTQQQMNPNTQQIDVAPAEHVILSQMQGPAAAGLSLQLAQAALASMNIDASAVLQQLHQRGWITMVGNGVFVLTRDQHGTPCFASRQPPAGSVPQQMQQAGPPNVGAPAQASTPSHVNPAPATEDDEAPWWADKAMGDALLAKLDTLIEINTRLVQLVEARRSGSVPGPAPQPPQPPQTMSGPPAGWQGQQTGVGGPMAMPQGPGGPQGFQPAAPPQQGWAGGGPQQGQQPWNQGGPPQGQPWTGAPTNGAPQGQQPWQGPGGPGQAGPPWNQGGPTHG